MFRSIDHIVSSKTSVGICQGFSRVHPAQRPSHMTDNTIVLHGRNLMLVRDFLAQ